MPLVTESIEYKVNERISAQQFIELLTASTLAQRRPVDDVECIQGMLDNCNLLVSAWQNDELIGVARSMTDYHYACYLSDLAVHQAYQAMGVGKQLWHITQNALNEKCKLILVSAPDANSYYAHIGFKNNPRCWILNPEDTLVGS